ncbi:hypothetical protein J6590_008696 [Homalodisca vitripennis]|nr:hypothetical protein J6590_008696 [Homalodisca vitripennis]
MEEYFSSNAPLDREFPRRTTHLLTHEFLNFLVQSQYSRSSRIRPFTNEHIHSKRFFSLLAKPCPGINYPMTTRKSPQRESRCRRNCRSS